MQEAGRMYRVTRIFLQGHDIAADFRGDALPEQRRQGQPARA
jgi:hypothetical protein